MESEGSFRAWSKKPMKISRLKSLRNAGRRRKTRDVPKQNVYYKTLKSEKYVIKKNNHNNREYTDSRSHLYLHWNLFEFENWFWKMCPFNIGLEKIKTMPLIWACLSFYAHNTQLYLYHLLLSYYNRCGISSSCSSLKLNIFQNVGTFR